MILAMPPRTPPPRRVSRRRYLVRRLVAFALLVGAVFGVSRLLTSVVDGADETTAEASVTPPGDVPADPSTDASAASTPAEVPNDTVTPPSTEPETTGPPTAADPAKVLIVGDSDAGTFGPYLERLLDETGVAAVELDYKVSSGLARPDFFDWPAHLRTQLPVIDPDIVVVTFGGNDSQGLSVASGEFIVGQPSPDADETNAEWRAEYGARVGEVMDLLAADGRTVIWVGIPNDDNPDVTFRLQVQDETVKAEAAKRPEIVLIDTWKRFSGRSGGWAEFVVDPRDGIGKDVRADDGFHLNENGAEILALDIATAVKADLVARGAAL